jgi:FKBP-type peptidyl-prolyl cis-trans isomerase 2
MLAIISSGGGFMTAQIQDGDVVKVHYTGRFEDGEVFDSSEGNDPLQFRAGTDDVIAGFDEGVRQMNVGDRKTIEIEPEKAYGVRHEQLVQTVPREGLNLDEEPEPGMTLVMQLPDGNQIPVVISEVDDQTITLDANHPLAGRKLIFDLERVE